MFGQTNRRAFVAGLGGAAAWPVGVRAQQPERVRRVGVLAPELPEQFSTFRQVLEQLGWLEGRNVRLDLRFSANNYERVPQLARELVALNPDVIFASTTPVVKALQAVASLAIFRRCSPDTTTAPSCFRLAAPDLRRRQRRPDRTQSQRQSGSCASCSRRCCRV
jgi:hypothetical protein